MDTNEVTQILLNGMSISFFIAMLIASFLGVLVLFLSDVVMAVKYDSRTPKKFEFGYMFKTGAARLIIGIIVLCVTIIYFGEISRVIFQVEEPLAMNGGVAFLVGLGIDTIVKKAVAFGKVPTEYLMRKKP